MHPTLVLLVLACACILGCASSVPRASANGRWVTSWTAVPEASDADRQPSEFYQSGLAFADSTIRQTICLTIGADQIRLRFSNTFATTDLPITKVTIASPKAEGEQNITGSSGIYTNTLQTLTFGGDEFVLIPAGALVVSDPVEFRAAPSEKLSVSVYVREGQPTEVLTTHPISRTDTWLALGNHTETGELADIAIRKRQGWYFLSAVEAWTTPNVRAFAILGDSLTEGTQSTMNTDSRWPNFLFHRMQEPGSGLTDISVLNQGAAGNRELSDGTGGVNAIARVDRDLLAQSGVAYAMIFEGVNDISYASSSPEEQMQVTQRLIQYYKQTIVRIHAFGIPVFGSTLTPFACDYATTKLFTVPEREQTRLRLNQWIRDGGWFDAVIDFDELLRDPSNHTQFDSAFDSGDCLHPNDEGYRKMANAFPLGLFASFKSGVNRFGKSDHGVSGGVSGLAGIGSNSFSSSSNAAMALSSPMLLSSIAPFTLGFFCCALFIIALPYARRLKRLSWSRPKPARYSGPDRHSQEDVRGEERSPLDPYENNKEDYDR